MATITLASAIKYITDETHGRIFGITFIKEDGSVRVMAAKYGVKKHVTGRGRTYEFEDYGLVPCFDTNKRGRDGYRCFRASNLLTITIDGVVFEVVKDPIVKGESDEQA